MCYIGDAVVIETSRTFWRGILSMKEHDKRQPKTSLSNSNHPRPDADQVEQPLDGDDKVSGTDVAGDETNVRTRKGVEKPGIVDKVPPQPE
jgi:hypothetical protein